MKDLPLVSVVMNCHNGSIYLQQSINSIYKQTYSNWEIIFWDNASDDDSASIAKSFDSKLKYFFSKEKTSLGEARNMAIEKASGKYICFLDCDDLYISDKLEKQVNMMERENFVLSYGSALIINDKGITIRKFPSKNNSGQIFERLLKHYEINMQSVILKRSFMKEHKLNFLTSMQYCPDYNLFMKIASQNEIGVIKDYLVKYRILKDSLSSKTIALVGKEIRLTLDGIIQSIPELKKKYIKGFELAYGKANYYDCISAIYDNDYKGAQKYLKPTLLLRLEYIGLYLILFLPLPRKSILSFLNRYIA